MKSLTTALFKIALNKYLMSLSSQSYEKGKCLGGPRKIFRIEFGPQQSKGWEPLSVCVCMCVFVCFICIWLCVGISFV